ncbi:Chromate resistance protein ChrB [Nonomuraea sp. NPDC049709]|uniref:Chromate resistance protein ChrB n=1 Tax=Nonomuraea sp. NPDC049709 TaxID=3154736 RepID=UPI0034360801
MADKPDVSGWLLVSVSTAGAAPTLRVQVWRKLRSLGALYLQQSVCLLPEREQTVRQMRRLLDRVHQQGGSGRMLHVALTDVGEERQIVGEFNAARDAEYAEVLERLPAFRQELAAERARGRATYAEVEESEADLERFRSWMAKIAARDYFAAPAGAVARAAVEDAAADLAAFEQAALTAEDPAEAIETGEQEGGRR